MVALFGIFHISEIISDTLTARPFNCSVPDSLLARNFEAGQTDRQDRDRDIQAR